MNCCLISIINSFFLTVWKRRTNLKRVDSTVRYPLTHAQAFIYTLPHTDTRRFLLSFSTIRIGQIMDDKRHERARLRIARTIAHLIPPENCPTEQDIIQKQNCKVTLFFFWFYFLRNKQHFFQSWHFISQFSVYVSINTFHSIIKDSFWIEVVSS
jgi:hypothetical protein